MDSSVLISAHLSRAGVCAGLLEDVLMHHQLVVSIYILDEVARKLREKFRIDAATIERVIASIPEGAEHVDPVPLPAQCCRDPADLPILGTAVAGRAKVLVTGDKDLLSLQQFEEVIISAPAGFWHLASGHAGDPAGSSTPA